MILILAGAPAFNSATLICKRSGSKVGRHGKQTHVNGHKIPQRLLYKRLAAVQRRLLRVAEAVNQHRCAVFAVRQFLVAVFHQVAAGVTGNNVRRLVGVQFA